MAIRLPTLPGYKPPYINVLAGLGTQVGSTIASGKLPGTVTRTPHKSSGSNTGIGAWAAGLSGGGSSSGGSTSYSGGGSSGGTTRTGSGGGAVSSAAWTCPAGATLVNEPGSSNLVCRWNHNGGLFAAIPSVGAAPAPVAPSSPLPGAVAPGVVAEGNAATWLQTAKDTFAQNPEAMLADMLLKKYGQRSNNQLYRQLEPYANDVNAMFLMQNGLNADSGTGDDFLNYTQNYWDTLQTPGQRIDYDTAMKNLFAAPGDNPLGAYVTDGDATDQSGNVMRLLSGAVEGKYSKIMASPIMKQLDLARQRYIGESARNTDVGTYLAYLQKNNPDLVRQLLA